MWLNSNMPSFVPKCPEHHLFELDGGRAAQLDCLHPRRILFPGISI